MNELLGWYGLPKMDKADTTRLSLAESYPASSGGHCTYLPSKSHDQSKTPSSEEEDPRTADAASPSESRKTPRASPAALSATVLKESMPTCTSRTESFTIETVGTESNKALASAQKADIVASESGSPLTADMRSLRARSDNCRSRKRKEGSGILGAKMAMQMQMTSQPLNDTNNNSNGLPDDDNGSDEDDLADDDENDDDDDDEDDDYLSDEIANIASPDVGPSDLGTAIICSWCQKDGTKLFTLATSAGVKGFCSELCFTQCRRASFKKNKVCDWCKHMRHKVNFVDFQEGNLQLQFCNEKCLNQYKMNIFCTEARQHLEQIQKMTGDGESKVTGSERSKGEILITPELWLSGNSSATNEIKTESSESCDEDDLEDVSHEMNEDRDEEKEPGELRERKGSVDSLRRSKRGASLDQLNKTVLSISKISRDDQRVSGTNENPLSEGNDEMFTGHKIRGAGGGKNHDSSRVQPSPTTSPAASNSRMGPQKQSQRRSRERIRRLLVGEPEERAGSPQTERADSTINPQRFHRLEPGAARVAGTPTAATALPEHQRMLNHPMLQHWATSQLLAMMPSISSSLQAPLATQSAAAHLASLGYASSSQMLYPALFGAAALQRPPASGETAAMQFQAARGTLPNAQTHGPNGFRTEDMASTLPAHNAGSDNLRSANPSPLSPSTSRSSNDTPGPTSTLPTSTLPHDFLQLMTNANSLGQGEDARLYHSYFGIHPRMPLPVNPHQFPRPPNFPCNTSSAHTETLHSNSATAGQGQGRPNGRAPRHPNAPLINQPIPPNLPQLPGVPPVTVLIPYPVAVPIPIPIPIPLPIAPEKLFAFFEEKSKRAQVASSSEGVTCPKERSAASRHRSRSSSSSGSKMSASSPLIVSPIPRPSAVTGIAPSGGRASSSSSISSSRGDQFVAASASGNQLDGSDSITMLRRDIGKMPLLLPQDFVSSSSLGSAVSPSLKRPAHPSSHNLQLQTLSIDLSKRARTQSSSFSHVDEDEAMDLRKISSKSESPSRISCNVKSENLGNLANSQGLHLSEDESISLRENRASSPSFQSKSFPPRIHIVLNEQPPLNIGSDAQRNNTAVSGTLPPLLDQSTYSSRRSRILDAPSVPRKTHSPSPERRYVRTVPRDMVEAARRRGLRARVRTK
ncbi:sine oculis-binding-like protein [Plakobranchus ocellatus]|uniref:Sine oculis-binding-like protein n=1 Tax=Plakobranchus ocellatus TaxID=259542 RepID=A0AAV3Y5W6_9GAST|nr:sine oculis-binding-like protein [Plakobranchus ocellatus]